MSTPYQPIANSELLSSGGKDRMCCPLGLFCVEDEYKEIAFPAKAFFCLSK